MHTGQAFRQAEEDEILCDLDGTLVNYERAIGYLFGMDIEGLRTLAGEKAPMNTHALLGTTLERIASKIHAGHTGDAAEAKMREFWASMPAFPGAIAFLRSLCQIAPVRIVTQPYPHPGSREGKQEWLARHGFGHLPVRFTDPHTGARAHLAHGRAALVDDNDAHLAAFDLAGGITARIPRPWNIEAEASSSPVAYTLVLAKLRTHFATPTTHAHNA